MKIKIITIALLFFHAIIAVAQNSVQITGQLEGSKSPQAVKLFKIVDGRLQEIATAFPQNEFQFGFNFFPSYEGLYVIGMGNEGSPNNNFKFYFKPGDRLDFTILFSPDLTYRLNGSENTPENVLLTEWHDLVFPLENRAINFMRTMSTYIDYFPLQEEIVAQARTFFQNKSTGNSRFDRMMPDIMSLDLAMYALNFLNTPRTEHPTTADYTPFYETLKAEDFSRSVSTIYNYPYGMRTLDQLIGLSKRLNGDDLASRDLAHDFKYVSNDTLKGDLLLMRIRGAKSISEYERDVKPFGKYLLTDLQQQTSKSVMYPLLEFKPGADAYQFTYPNPDGKMVSMADLKGKVVLVDVWATWCGPCRAQFPHLRALKEQFADTDLQVVGISVDEAKDAEKWKKMIVDEQLEGIQLFADGWSEITKYYKITGIPRFMVFDKQGKIVDVNAPRPSDPALKVLLEQELAKP